MMSKSPADVQHPMKMFVRTCVCVCVCVCIKQKFHKNNILIILNVLCLYFVYYL